MRADGACVDGSCKHPDRRSLDPGIVCVAGKGRSGTTLVGRILEQHPQVAVLPELHFFEQLSSPSRVRRPITRRGAVRLAAAILERARFDLGPDAMSCRSEALDVVATMQVAEPSPIDVFIATLSHEARVAARRFICDQTPRNIFFARDILEASERARLVIVIRDPRDVFAAQKQKSSVRIFGSYVVPWSERWRARVNASPIPVALQWRTAVRAGSPYNEHPRVHVVRFEDLVGQPRHTVTRLCAFLGLDLEGQMLEVAHYGPGFEDTGRSGLQPHEAGRWRQLLTPTEVFLCEAVAGGLMSEHGYPRTGVRPDAIKLALAVGALPFQAVAALALNRRYYSQMIRALRQRLQPGRADGDV